MQRIKSLPKSFWLMAILSLVIAIIIFKFSSQDSSASDDMSIGFARMLLERIFGADFATEHNHFIRKCAHFSIYLALGFCIKIALDKGKLLKSVLSSSVISAFVCFVYAATDEIHQFFVPGRSCSVLDVFLDTFGAICGILFSYILFKRSRGRIKKST